MFQASHAYHRLIFSPERDQLTDRDVDAYCVCDGFKVSIQAIRTSLAQSSPNADFEFRKPAINKKLISPSSSSRFHWISWFFTISRTTFNVCAIASSAMSRRSCSSASASAPVSSSPTGPHANANVRTSSGPRGVDIVLMRFVICARCAPVAGSVIMKVSCRNTDAAHRQRGTVDRAI